MPAFTQPFTLTAQGNINVPFALHVGNPLGNTGGGITNEGTASGHWTDANSQFGFTAAGRTHPIVAVLGMNSVRDVQGETPGAGGDQTSTWTNAGIPTNGTVSPMIHWHFTDGVTDRAYTAYANGTFDNNIRNMLTRWHNLLGANATLYSRVSWEFNTTTFNTWNVTPANATGFVNAFKRAANVMHQFGITNNRRVRTIWNPDTAYSSILVSTGNVANYFPAPDASAVGGRYVDIIAGDTYMGGYGVKSNFGQSGASLWSMGTFVNMCQTNNCNFGLGETGDGPNFDQNNSTTDGTMVNWANYLNTLKTLSPAVPIELIALWDLNVGGAAQCTGGGSANMVTGWRSCLGVNGNGSVPQITTIPPI